MADFEDVVEAMLALEGVEPPRGGSGFGSGALKVRGRIFAMWPRDHLVVKLPAARVSQLITERVGVAFDANKGRPMREWLTVTSPAAQTWLSLAQEAYEFVRGE